MDNLKYLIPDSCLTFSEMIDYVKLYSKDEYSKLMESIGIYELEYFKENYNTMVYTEASISELKDKILGTLKKIVRAVEVFWAKTTSIITGNSNKMISTQLDKNKIAAIPTNIVIGKTYTFKGISEYNFKKNSEEFIRKANKALYKTTNDNAEDIFNELKATLYSNVSDVSCKSYSEMKSNLKDKLLGDEIEVNSEWILKNYSLLTKFIYNSGNIKEVVNQSRDEDISIFDQIEKKIEAFDDSETEIANQWCDLMIDLSNACHACYAVKMDVLKRLYVDYLRIARATVKLQEKYNN